eukprot:UC4_evm2s485
MHQFLLVLPSLVAGFSLGLSGPRHRSSEGFLPLSATRLPSVEPRYQMNRSTIIMPCNNSGYMDPERTKAWSIIDFDWSNGKAIWTKSRPMNDEEVLQNQVVMSTKASLGQTVWVYRGSMWGGVRKTLEDPAYSDCKKCDAVNKTDCSDAYHCQEQSPAYPHGDGNCGAPNCDCGNMVPCNMLHCLCNTCLTSYSMVYFSPDPYSHMVSDMGLTPSMQKMISQSYTATMTKIYDELIKRGMFSWQQQWNGQANPNSKNGCCTGPLVSKGSSCAPTLRKLCAADSPAQTRVLNYAFSPGRCRTDPSHLTDPLQDIANFLLIRGPQAFLGHGWLGCSRQYSVPEQLNWDYGEPTELCKETAPNSGIFIRDWTKATIEMDCNTWTPTIKLK